MILALLPSLLHLYDLLKVFLLMLITFCLVDNPANLISAQVMHFNCKNPEFQVFNTKFNATCKLFTNQRASLTQVLVNFLFVLAQEVIALWRHSSQILAAQFTCTVQMQSEF